MTSPSAGTEPAVPFRFGVQNGFSGFVLDRKSGQLQGPDGEVRLRPQAFRLLEVLVEGAPGILSQDELLDRAWGVEHLSPASVKQAISEIRQALGDDPARPAIIATVPRRGYRFIAPIESLPATEPAPPQPVPVPEARFRPALVLTILALALAAGLALRLAPRDVPTGNPPPAATPSRPALAVLGFKNLSADPDDEWVSSALAELLSFELTAAGRVRVIPADNVARMKRELSAVGAENQSRAGLTRIGRNLGNDLLLTGSYLKEQGGKLRLQVLVQNVRTGETVAWARETGSREELAGLAGAAARGLETSFGGRSRSPLPAAATLASSSASLRLYAESLERIRMWDDPAALRLLERAAALDPDSPFVQDALAGTAFRLGFDKKAGEASGRAVTHAAGLPREIRLGMQARSRVIAGEWEEAARIDAELRRAFPDDLEHGLHLADTQRMAGRTREALATIEALRKLPPPAGDDPRLDVTEADAAWQLGDFARSRDAASRAVARGTERGMAMVVAMGRFNRAWALSRLGRPGEALADFDAARTLYLRIGDRGSAASALMGRAMILQDTGRTAESWKAYEEAISTLREIGDLRREAKALNNFAKVLNDEGDLAAAVLLLERSLEIKRETGDLQGAAVTLTGLGNTLRVRGDLPGAHRRLEEALDLSRGLGDDHGTAFSLRGLARLLSQEERFGEARSALEEAVALCAKTGDGDGAAESRLALGELEEKTGRPERAREQYRLSLAEFHRLNLPADELFSHLRLALLSQQQRRLEEARTSFQEALALAGKLRNDYYAAHSHVGLAEVAALQGRQDAARAEYRQALALWEKLGNEEEAEKARKALQES
ncbi:MAG: eukaryotic-like serine/threonine-protein kinase [Acidobacteriota bacterium]|jgi:DNA-binding winged helix-turn-helix (wHTH) protein/tetratricopeptide (TPR) repeat protein/TolB-like protein|nr:eukaryotic-like serine/threonine-protein kinase [Acidobacteriota bacterium]